MELLDGLTLQQWTAALTNDVDSRTLLTTTLHLSRARSQDSALDTPSWWTRTLDSKRSWQAEPAELPADAARAGQDWLLSPAGSSWLASPDGQAWMVTLAGQDDGVRPAD